MFIITDIYFTDTLTCYSDIESLSDTSTNQHLHRACTHIHSHRETHLEIHIDTFTVDTHAVFVYTYIIWTQIGIPWMEMHKMQVHNLKHITTNSHDLRHRHTAIHIYIRDIIRDLYTHRNTDHRHIETYMEKQITETLM